MSPNETQPPRNQSGEAYWAKCQEDEDNYTNKHQACFVHGSLSGCHPSCPVWRNGECEMQEENRQTFLEKGTLDEE